MSSTSIPLVSIGTALAAGNNSFLSGWGDKRSATSAGVSIVFYGTNHPDGYAWIEVSNAIQQPGNTYTLPNNGETNLLTAAASGDDAEEWPGSQTSITLNPITGLYTAQWQIADCPARWIRLRYTAVSSVSGLTVNVYLNAPHHTH